jgi:hypothetical protein
MTTPGDVFLSSGTWNATMNVEPIAAKAGPASVARRQKEGFARRLRRTHLNWPFALVNCPSARSDQEARLR